MNRILLKVRNDLIFSKRFIETTKYPVVSVKDIRNIGIIAHIDAGKTTVTERLLFLTGQTSIVGDVDDGNTVTDFMDLERERGITIQSAAVTSFWRNHRINLIDTPGHVDFTLEVERCLRVLDGAVTVLDASAGVQAQTLTVWRQANKFKVPCVFFINKMDKIGANFQKSLDSIESRLNQRVCAVTIPIFENSKFIGVVDLLKKKYLDIQNPKSDWSLIPENAKYFDELLYGREELFSRIGETNAEFAEKMLNSANLYNFPENVIISALKKSTIERSLAPVGCGTALRHNKTVEPVLDMIVDYLPNPLERNYHLPANDFCGLVFKIVHDKRKGQLSYVRVYKGELKHAQSVKNLNRNTVESGLKIFTPFSDDFQLSDKVTEGNIAVISGLSSTITGDTLIGAKEGKLKHETKLEGHSVNVLDGIDLPDSVFFCSIEPPNSGAIRAFEKALNELVIEDPSLKIRQDVETGQTILEGMGELHIEVVKERLNREYGLNVFMGPLRVGYREVIDSTVEETATVEDSFAEIKFKQSCSLTFQIEPITDDTKFNKVHVELDEETSSTPYVRPEWLKAINEGCKNALYNGPVLGFPVHNVKIVLKNLIASGGKINPALLSACASKCVTKALKKSGAHLIEPVMLVEVHMIDEAAEQGMHGILQELARRRAILRSVTRQDAQGHSIIVEARIPLSETTGISNEIRSISSGLGALHMQFLEYEQVSEHEQAMLLERFHKRSAFG